MANIKFWEVTGGIKAAAAAAAAAAATVAATVASLVPPPATQQGALRRSFKNRYAHAETLRRNLRHCSVSPAS